MNARRWLMIPATALALCFAIPAQASDAVPPPAAHQGPVTASLTVRDGESRDTAQLVLTLQIAEPWHIHAKSSRSAVLEIELRLPSGTATEGDWIRPKPRVVYQDERVEVYAGEQTFRRALRFASAAKGRITAIVRFQACDPTVCRPPEELSVAVELGGRAAP